MQQALDLYDPPGKRIPQRFIYTGKGWIAHIRATTEATTHPDPDLWAWVQRATDTDHYLENNS